MRVFYCSKCKTYHEHLEMSNAELRIRSTWTNIRDGYGHPINHMVCPHCGYVLSGYMNLTYEEIQQPGYIEYIIDVIDGYASKDVDSTVSFMPDESIDYIANSEIKRLKQRYSNIENRNDAELIKKVVESACPFD